MFEFSPRHKFLVGIDSDGCAFDSMEVKHKECFIPNFINSYDLQGVSKYARETWEFVNLYSKTRGCNRFPALVETLRLLAERPEVIRRGVRIPSVTRLDQWCRTETRLANPALAAAVEATGDEELRRALDWSQAVNQTIAQWVRGVPPFPGVRESLARMAENADLLVISATPNEALLREWQEHDIEKYVSAICGQEIGTKKETLAVAKNYAAGQALMIGDAPGDYQAAVANGALFFPINPGAEEASWQRLCREGIERFFQGTFAGEYQAGLLAEFEALLPASPPWQRH